MRNAPSVLIPVGRSRLGVFLPLAAWLAGLTLLVAWRVQVPDPDGWAGWSAAQALMAGLLAVCGLLAWRIQRRAATGLLDWNGDSWCWTTARGDCNARVTVACDLQRRILLRLDPDDGSGLQWLWLAPTRGEEHWRALRRALSFSGSRQPPSQRPAVPP